MWQWAGFGKRVLVQESEVHGDGNGDSEDSEEREDRLAVQRLAQARQAWEEEMNAGIEPSSLSTVNEESAEDGGVVLNGDGQADEVEGSFSTVYLSAEESGVVINGDVAEQEEQHSESFEEETGGSHGTLVV